MLARPPADKPGRRYREDSAKPCFIRFLPRTSAAAPAVGSLAGWAE